MRQQNMLELY